MITSALWGRRLFVVVAFMLVWHAALWASGATPDSVKPTTETLSSAAGVLPGTVPASVRDAQYIVIGWNDLGMHCMGLDFSSLCILPPANSLWAQVIHRGDPPQLVRDDAAFDLRYRFQGNTTSAGKVNFWQYAQATFGLASPLADDVGLAGKAMTGTLDWNGSAYEAQWVPLTPFDDATSTVLQPYQLAEVSLVRASDQQVLDTTLFVAPVSTEMHCDKCHPLERTSLPVYDSILALHDEEEGTHLLTSKPVLCASCHADNALGAAGKAGVPNLSRAIHGKHAESEGKLVGISCYDCHPGPQTQCLRDVMYMADKRCEDCHGNMSQMAQGLKNGRRPWIDEPKCATCHPDYSEDADGTVDLYRQSTGHGGLYCAACHNSPHAILPTVQYRDGLQALRLQGEAAPLGNCMICHTKPPSGAGPHGMTYVNATRPAAWRSLR